MPESTIAFKDDLRRQRDMYEWILELMESNQEEAKKIINKELKRINESLQD